MPTENPPVSRRRVNAGTFLVVLNGLMLIASALAKLAHVPPVVEELGAMGFAGGRLTFIAILEMVSALLFLVPSTRSAGLLLVSSFLGGAIATHLQHAKPILQPSVVLSFVWLATWLRHPEMLWSLGYDAFGMRPLSRQCIAKAFHREPEMRPEVLVRNLGKEKTVAPNSQIAPWLTRLILLPPTFVFTMIAFKYISHPAEMAATVGIALNTPLAATILRIGFGAFPLGCALFTLSCLVSRRRLLIGLGFVATMMSVALAVRIFGIVVDGTARQSMPLVIAEVVLLAITLVGVAIETGRRRHHAQHVVGELSCGGSGENPGAAAPLHRLPLT